MATKTVQLTVTAKKDGVVCDLTVEGEMVAPGLALAKALHNGEVVNGRWTLTHVPSGLRLSGAQCCRTCVQEALRIAVASGADWTGGEAAVKADARARQAWSQIVGDGYGFSCPAGDTDDCEGA